MQLLTVEIDKDIAKCSKSYDNDAEYNRRIVQLN